MVYIEKLAVTENSLPPINKEDRIPGTIQWSDGSLPIAYNIEGSIISGFEVGKRLLVARTKRNGVEMDGLFTTSGIKEIGEDYFKTENSIYKYRFL